MAKYNILVKRDKEHTYLIKDFMATSLSKNKFEKLKEQNKAILGDFDFIPYNETDFMWWNKIEKYLTPTKIVKAYFNIDFYGNVTKY